MNTISNQLFYSTARLEVNLKDGTPSVGTGFFFEYGNRTFLVTNKHVIENMNDGKFLLNKRDIDGNILVKDHVTITFSESDFIGHPTDDIDVSVFDCTETLKKIKDAGEDIVYIEINESIIPSEDDVYKLIDAVEEIIFIGYPSGVWDQVNNLPIIRKGTTATPYKFDFEGNKTFLIDASVFGGSSGSPVYAYSFGTYSDNEGTAYVGSKLFFLGIIARAYFKTDYGKLIEKNIPTGQEKVTEHTQMIDLGVVFKASTIVEAIKNYLSVV